MPGREQKKCIRSYIYKFECWKKSGSFYVINYISSYVALVQFWKKLGILVML